MRTSPARGSYSPVISLPSVDLPLPEFADQRDPLAGRHIEREILDQRRLERAVAEAHVLHRQPAGGARRERRRHGGR